MDDKRLQQLIRMAVEIDEIEAADPTGAVAATSAPVIPFNGEIRLQRHARRRVWGRIASLAATAAAACVAAAWFWSGPAQQIPLNRQTPLIVQSPSMIPPTLNNAQPSSAPGDAYVVLAIFRSADGKCQCKSWRVDRLAPGKTLAQLENGELLDAALNGRCVEEIERLQVMALAGRPDQLPTHSEQLEPLLECLEQARPPISSDHPATFAVAGSSCVPGGLTVRTQYLTVSNR